MPKKIIIFDSDALKNIHKRVFFSITVFVIVFSIIFLRIFDVMIFEKKSIKINQNKQTVDRGKIFDRNGILLASTIKSYSLFANPKKIKEIDNLSKNLELILNIPEDKIKLKLSKNINFVWIKRKITPREHQKIIILGEVGVQT